MDLKTSQLKFKYTSGPTFAFPDVALSSGEGLLITGKSGCGKSTFLHLLAGLLTPESGQILYGETEIISLGQKSKRKLDAFRGAQLGIIYQQPHFVRALKAEQNLTVARYCAGLAADYQHANALTRRLGIDHLLSKFTRELSLGEQQRLGIARALVVKPSVLLCDEPTSSLDDENAEEVILLLKEESQLAGASLIIVTHDARVHSHFSNSIVLSSKEALEITSTNSLKQ